MAKQNLLGEFAQRNAAAPSAPRTLAPTKATGEVLAVTVRLVRDDWERLSDYARKNRVSLQALVEHGCSRILEDQGLKPLNAVVARHRNANVA